MPVTTAVAARSDSPGEPQPDLPPPTLRDCRQVGALALASLLVLAFIGYLDVFVAPSFAPRVFIRWQDGVSDMVRTANERQLKLVAGELREGTTWAYDLPDASPQTIGAIVAHASVVDTGNINRSRKTISDEGRLGTTRIRGGLSRWRDAPVMPWLTRLASACLGLSVLWLATTARPAVGVFGRARWLRRIRSSAGDASEVDS